MNQMLSLWCDEGLSLQVYWSWQVKDQNQIILLVKLKARLCFS